MLEIFIPAMNQSYDFELDEHTRVAELIRDIEQLLVEKEAFTGTMEKHFLYAFEREGILDEENTLYHQGILSGSELVML